MTDAAAILVSRPAVPAPSIRPVATSAASRRIWAGMLAGGLAGLLGVGAWLTPASGGHGTHTQLGMAPCMWAAAFDVPCPTCGMTTAFAHAAHGHFAAAFAAQPLGCVVALVAAAVLCGAVHVAATGSRLDVVAGRLVGARLLWIVAGAALAAWAYKYATWA